MVKLEELLDEALKSSKRRNFVQSVDVIVTIDKNRAKAQTFNELVYLPVKFRSPDEIVIIGSGDVALEAKRQNLRLVDPDTLDRLATNKREAKKLATRSFAFIAEASLMPRVGKALGPILAPRGKMPVPIPNVAALQATFERLLGATRLRGRNVFGVQAKIGYENMSKEDLLKNAKALIDYLEKKLPPKSIDRIGFKLTMGKPVKAKYDEVS
ncbi:MAG: 50S ribosomal protein L1 [Nitrososphaeria archaeon]